MTKLRAFVCDIESLCSLSSVPPLPEQRPCSCPGCEQPAYLPGGALGIHGHGTYQRQVRGFAPGQWFTIFIRRFYCLGCKRTISVLPDCLVPRRWYLAATILKVLIDVLLLRMSVADLRASVGPGDLAPHWRAPADWAHATGVRLWERLVVGLDGANPPAPEARLEQLLGFARIHKESPPGEVEAAALRLTRAAY